MGWADGTCQKKQTSNKLFAFLRSPTSFVPSCASATIGKAEIRAHTCDTPCYRRVMIHPTILSVQYAHRPKGPRSAIQGPGLTQLKYYGTESGAIAIILAHRRRQEASRISEWLRPSTDTEVDRMVRLTDTGKRGGTGLTTHGKKFLRHTPVRPPPRLATPDLECRWGLSGRVWSRQVEENPSKCGLRTFCVGNILMQPARLEVVLRLIRVRRDRGPCGCYLCGFDR
jgi:hypothetical protein